MDAKERKFSERDYAVPFGRYQSGNELGTPNEVLVGREEQRAYFIELLLRMGQRGAYLVTGQRGVGKTSFVHYCLGEYKEEVFERFLRSSVGRVMFWDHAGVLLLAFGIIFVLLMVSELMEILALSAGWGKGDQPDILFSLVIIPLALICLYPLLYAREIIARVFDATFSPQPSQSLDLLATVVTLGLVWGAFFVEPFGAPALSMSRLFLAICSLFLWAQATSFESYRDKGKGPERNAPEGGRHAVWIKKARGPFLRTGIPLVAVIGACILGGRLLQGDLAQWGLPTHQEYAGNLLWGLMLLGTGAILRAFHLAWLLPIGRRKEELPSLRRRLGSSPAVWYLFFGSALLLSAMIAFYWPLAESTAWPSCAAGVVMSLGSVILYAWRLRKWLPNLRVAQASQSAGSAPVVLPAFRPRPLLVLAIKACLAIVVSLQLVHPVLDKWTRGQQTEIDIRGELNQPRLLRQPISLNLISSLASQEYDAVAAAYESRQRANRWKRYLDQQRALGRPVREDWAREAVSRENEALKKEEISLRMQAEASLAPRRRDSVVFYGRSEELSWVAALFLALAVLYLIEYEWVVRPFVREREDRALDLAASPPWQDQQLKSWTYRREFHRRLARLSLPWMVFEKWLPVLTVSVNLGFEKLDHRRVVHAMLAGLRDQYQRVFRAWNSSLANLGRLFAVLVLMMLVTLAGERWFSMPVIESTDRGGVQAVAWQGYGNLCDLFDGRQWGSSAANWLCKLRWGNSIVHILYYNLLETSAVDLYPDRGLHLLFHVFPYSEQSWPSKEVAGDLGIPTLLEAGIHLRVYHVVLFLLFFVLGRWLLHHLPIFPYRELLQRIDDTMDSLATRTSVTSTTGRWKPAQWLQGFFMDERVRQTEQDPVDPRTVEFVFLQILRDVQGTSLQLPGGSHQLISLPTPEITFVLDELDKIGTRVDPDEAASSGGAQQAEIINAERRRSMELHRLLADMKNLLSSAPARFVFVGGRNLHDEWLADQTARQPLLTNIFTAEVYLPSLLTDCDEWAQREAPRLSMQVRRYVFNQKNRAERLYRRAWKKRWLPMLALPLEHRERESFLQLEEPGTPVAFQIYDTVPGQQGGEICFPGGKDLEEDFIQFLTYRSMGNSKKLKELLATFVRPAGRVVSHEERRWNEFRDCDHVLLFGDTERFRIQLLARVYRHLAAHFEQDLVRRDDKLTASVLYLTDFLFKFHRRAFSWSNLERVDELVHIHRAPDLREILEAIVAQWSERFLHPIRNGMYDFRFRSDMAREIEYVSRQSAEEMAAFNFTLDESQTLKAAYETNISRLESSKELQDLVAGLGELHEFDQEYETARLYYRRAISLLDAELEDVIGNSPFESDTPRIEIIGGLAKGQENARLYMTWGVARLRLMLQIGMTFEHSRNLERAEMEYQNARTLARSLLLAMLDDEGRQRAADLGIRQAVDATGDDRLHALKHLNILFQPVFAEIWVAEKLAGGVDTSTSLAEKELWHLRGMLPFVREPRFAISESPTEVQGSNFALIATELHNKTGDLYFIKGRQLPVICSTEDIEERFRASAGSEGLEGYLLRAHYHYAVGLHEVRRFVTHRRRSSESKLSLGGATPTIVRGGWPDFVFRAAGGAFNDLAECLLGRISLLALLREWTAASPGNSGAPVEGDLKGMIQTCTEWLEGADQKDTDLLALTPETSRLRELGPIRNWVGKWNDDRLPTDPQLIEFPVRPGTGGISTLAASLGFSFVGARYLEQGGYLEDSGREMIKVCETVSHCLWWGLTVRHLAERGLCGTTLQEEKLACWDDLFNVALHALREADRLFQRSRRTDGEDGPYLVGKKIPVAALTQACSLGLAACRWGKGDWVEDGLKTLLWKWTAMPPFDGPGQKDGFVPALRTLLQESLVRHSYPMINRLHTLRTLIDDTILGREIGRKIPAGTVATWTEELLDLDASLKAPFHFTPLHSGTTCALVYLSSHQDLRLPKIGNAAERALLASEEMYSMRRAFYESISDLYYLYDDFNDRQLHFNHAIQMAGAELASLLRYLLFRPDQPSGTPAPSCAGGSGRRRR